MGSSLSRSLLLLALAHWTYALFPDCLAGPMSNTSVCDTTLDPLSRARALVGLMTMAEKFNNTVNASPGVPRLGLPAYNWWSEGLHGVASSPGVTFEPAGQNFSYATSFPEPILMGAAFDDNLIYDVATVVSTEARAFNNFNHSGLDFWTPNINPVRDPRWGRSLETPGEDPYHLASYVAKLVTGLQFGGDDPKYQKLVATCKHFAGYDLENWGGYARYGFDAVISNQDLVEYFLPPFQTCARDVNVTSIMCSYNAVNGIPTCASDYLLQTLLRTYWQWETDADSLIGHYVTSDCDAVSNIYSPHNYTITPQQAVAVALKAGTDLDCGTFYAEWLPSSYEQGLFNQTDIDRALIRSYAALFKLGYFDPPQGQIYRAYDWSNINTDYAQQLAYTAAWEGITLLKNIDDMLPLPASMTKIALIGPWANATTQMQGNYQGIAPFLHSPLYALQQRGISVTYALGTNVTSQSTAGFSAALAAAQTADLTLYIGGIDITVEAEAMDRVNVTWPGNQLDLIAQLANVSTHLVVFQMGGGQIDDTALLENEKVHGLLWAGYPGQDGGTAMIDILFGDRAPAGRLPMSQYPGDFVNEVPMTDMRLRPALGTPGRTYKWYTGDLVLPFGYGLHYTTFYKAAPQDYSPRSYDVQTLVNEAKQSGQWLDKAFFDVFAAEVTNNGAITSDYVALGFLTGEFGPAPYPKSSLVSYTRLSQVTPGETQVVNFDLTLGSLARADYYGNLYLYPGTYTLVIDVVEPVEVATFYLTGNTVLLSAWPAPSA
ncbi:glycoside hydrolase family 3 protein [Calocera cornea HHB12733]|uniref:xylan 1,4-beta-xylosidase n=1 Tax=Calocera cornea HHB12733 TaxID=1353952 RepID=A0A165IDV4_9BASI|nr:glycoside hydrolase family 3 protein [Calocera cornea HHB12733]